MSDTPRTVPELREWCIRQIDRFATPASAEWVATQAHDPAGYAIWQEAYRLACCFGATDVATQIEPPTPLIIYRMVTTDPVPRLTALVAWCNAHSPPKSSTAPASDKVNQTRAAESIGQEGRGRKVQGKSAQKRGRPIDTEPDADRRLWEAWRSRGYRTYEQLAREKGLTLKQVQRAIDRHRKRRGQGTPE